jgi:taurine dioxygenase
MDTVPLSPFGVEITGIDLSSPPSAEDSRALVNAYEDHHLLLVRDQSLSVDAQARVMELLGPVRRDAYDRGASYVAKEAEIDGEAKTGVIGSYALSWHSDGTYVPEPTLALSLHALAIGGPTSTRFASGALAFRQMPEAMRERVRSLEALHVRPHSMVTRNRLADLEDFEPRQVRPVIGHDHHRTGEAAVWVNFQHTDSIVGLGSEESEQLIEEIFSYLYGNDGVYEHWWAVGDIIIWDNLAVQHSRDEIGDEIAARTLQRVSVETLTFEEQMFPGYTQTAVSDGGRPPR